MKNKIFSFSSDTGKLSIKDGTWATKLSESYFKMSEDSSQFYAKSKDELWIYHNFPDCLNIIRFGRKKVGHTFIFPSNKRLMRDFLRGKMTESELFKESKNIKSFPPECIYLCAAIIQEEFRNKGLATLGLVKSIRKVSGTGKPVLFYWGFSEEGKKLCRKVAKLTGLELREKLELE